MNKNKRIKLLKLARKIQLVKLCEQLQSFMNNK